MHIGYCLISTEPGHAESVLEALEKIDEVEEAYMAYGNWDIVTKIKADTSDKLRDTIIRVRLLDKVQRTQTMVVMGETK